MADTTSTQPRGDADAEPPYAVPSELVTRARGLVEQARADGRRRLLGLTGVPGAGKSTLAEALTAALTDDAVYVPMDGFHLANAELVRLGIRDRKGAEHTFDAGGYTALLRRLHDPDEDVVYAPKFDRAIEEPVAGAIPIAPDVPLVVTEGNYLLVDGPRWGGVRRLLDETWYVEVSEQLRLDRLIARHIAFGKEPDFAHRWATSTDQRNADLIATTRDRANLAVTPP